MILLDKINPSVRTTVMAVCDLREAGVRGRGFVTRGSGSDTREIEKDAPFFLITCVCRCVTWSGASGGGSVRRGH